MNLPRMLGFGLLLLLSSTLVLAAPVADQGAAPATLDFEDRVHAQAAIEHVYHGHRTGNTGTFEVAVPVEVLEAKVRDFLRRSHALELRWKTSITDAMLHRELQRMIRETRNPGRLWELFAALGNDPVLIRECLARPILVNRLTRNFSASDETYDSKSAWQLFPDTPVRTVAAHGASALTRPAERDCGPNGWDPYDLSPFPRTGHHAIWTGSEMIIWGGSGYTSGGLYDPATDSWSRMSLPETGMETFDTAVWTGTEMIVWFGRSWPGPTPPISGAPLQPGLRLPDDRVDCGCT